MTTAKDTAATAAAAVRTQITKEKLWREWLYCELGGSPAGVSGNWWTFSQNTTTAALTNEPASCIVPAVRNAANDADVRAAVTYYSSKAVVTAEPDDGSQRWNATLDLTTATSAETNSAERSAVDSGMGNS